MNRQTLFLVLVVTTVPLWFSTLHAEDSCEPVFAALTKMTSTPNHAYTIFTNPSMFGGKPTSTETIYFRDKAFMKLDGPGPRPLRIPRKLWLEKKATGGAATPCVNSFDTTPSKGKPLRSTPCTVNRSIRRKMPSFGFQKRRGCHYVGNST